MEKKKFKMNSKKAKLEFSVPRLEVKENVVVKEKVIVPISPKKIKIRSYYEW